jgi:hypothetical protein
MNKTRALEHPNIWSITNLASISHRRSRELRMAKIIGVSLETPKTFRKNRLPNVSASHPKEKSKLCQAVDLT